MKNEKDLELLNCFEILYYKLKLLVKNIKLNIFVFATNLNKNECQLEIILKGVKKNIFCELYKKI